MCGVVAMFARAEHVVAADDLDRAIRALRHRGPDGEGRFVNPARTIGLGHTRLSIVDLAGGAQPLSSEDGSVHAVVNGELYDDARVRAELERRGHRFRTRSDSEIAVHLYEEHGPRFVELLRGEFAILLWDERRQRLIAARDRFGIKPLYRASSRGMLLFASEMKALVAAGVVLEWDPTAVASFGAFHACGPAATPFSGVDQVAPGHLLVCTRDAIEDVAYWELEFPPRGASPATQTDDERRAEELRDVLGRSVGLRLRADVPVACYLSGGIDSSAVLALAARQSSRPVATFTIAFDTPEYDEAAQARDTARAFDADHHEVPVTARDLAEHFAEAVWHSETLFANLHGVAKFLLSRAVRDAGFKVVLTGEGADEAFAGYAGFARDMLLHNHEGQSPDEVARLTRRLELEDRMQAQVAPPGDSAGISAIEALLHFVPGWLHERRGTASAFERLLHPDVGATALPHFDAARLAGRDPVNQSLYIWVKTFFANYILNVLGDRMEMAHSVEGRVPFLDHEVFELAAGLPVHQKRRGGSDKYLLRAAMAPLVPRAVVRRPKQAFAAPPMALLGSGRIAELTHDTLRGSTLDALPFVDRRRVVELLDRLDGLDGHARVDIEPVLIGLLSACFLQRGLVGARAVS